MKVTDSLASRCWTGRVVCREPLPRLNYTNYRQQQNWRFVLQYFLLEVLCPYCLSTGNPSTRNPSTIALLHNGSPFWGFGSPFYVLGPLFFNFRLKNLGKMCHICIFFRNYSKWIGEGEGLMLQWPENIRIRWVLLVVKVIQYNVHFQYFRYIRNHIFSFTMHFLLCNATTVWLSRPDISGPARISGHLGKIARIFVILPGSLWFSAHLAFYWAVCQTAK